MEAQPRAIRNCSLKNDHRMKIFLGMLKKWGMPENCERCNLPFVVGDAVHSNSNHTMHYHAKCYEELFYDKEAPSIPSKVKPKGQKTAKKPLPEVRVKPYWKIGQPHPAVPEPWSYPLPNHVLYPWVQIHKPFPEAKPLLKVTRIRTPRRRI
jgi:hypothetical protein